MKINFILTSLLIAVLSVSCSNDSPETKTETKTETVNTAPVAAYFPLTDTNYWEYAVNNNGTDHLFVGADTAPYKKLQTAATPKGFFSTIMNNNTVKMDSGKLIINGSFDLDLFSGIIDPVNFAVADFTLFDEKASLNSVLSTTSGTFNRTTTEDYPLTINYTLKTIYDGSMPTFTSNGKEYTDIIKTKAVINMTITTMLYGYPATVLAAQDVVTSTHYYSKNIGMVYATTTTGYNMNPSLASMISVPVSSSKTEEEFLSTYKLN